MFTRHACVLQVISCPVLILNINPMKFKFLSVLSVLALSSFGNLQANTAIREWSYMDGSKFRAMVTEWHSETDEVTLSTDNEKITKVNRTELSLGDQAYVRQWFNFRAKLDAKLTEMGGEMEFLQTTGTYQTDYYVYKPSTYKADDSAPMMVLFSSSGAGYRMMLRHFEAAEKTGFVLVTADYFSNHTLDFYDKHGLKAVSEDHFREMLPQLETISHDPNQLFMGGDSGGALRAYMYSAIFDRPWAGIYANGGWLGRDYTMQCRKGMRVAMTSGHKDIAANRSAKVDGDYLVNKRNCEVGVFAFEGGHQLASTEAQIESFNWLLGNAEEE